MNVMGRKALLRGVVVLFIATASTVGLAVEEKDGVETLRKASRAFSEVAEKATPAVVAVRWKR
jgi:hypothetical protein